MPAQKTLVSHGAVGPILGIFKIQSKLRGWPCNRSYCLLVFIDVKLAWTSCWIASNWLYRCSTCK